MATHHFSTQGQCFKDIRPLTNATIKDDNCLVANSFSDLWEYFNLKKNQ